MDNYDIVLKCWARSSVYTTHASGRPADYGRGFVRDGAARGGGVERRARAARRGVRRARAGGAGAGGAAPAGGGRGAARVARHRAGAGAGAGRARAPRPPVQGVSSLRLPPVMLTTAMPDWDTGSILRSVPYFWTVLRQKVRNTEKLSLDPVDGRNRQSYTEKILYAYT